MPTRADPVSAARPRFGTRVEAIAGCAACS